MAKREFFEAEILVNFDQRMRDEHLYTSGYDERTDGSEAWREVRKVLRGLGFNMDKADGWSMLGVT
eukprot:14514772-Heterocapsa_arctica.AAC.1